MIDSMTFELFFKLDPMMKQKGVVIKQRVDEKKEREGYI